MSDNPYERGNGLWTTIRLVIEGNVGEILIISRKRIIAYFEEDTNMSYWIMKNISREP